MIGVLGKLTGIRTKRLAESTEGYRELVVKAVECDKLTKPQLERLDELARELDLDMSTVETDIGAVRKANELTARIADAEAHEIQWKSESSKYSEWVRQTEARNRARLKAEQDRHDEGRKVGSQLAKLVDNRKILEVLQTENPRLFGIEPLALSPSSKKEMVSA